MTDKKRAVRERISLAATLVSVGVVAIFLGYAMGQYAIRLMADPFIQPASAPIEREVQTQIRETPPPQIRETPPPVEQPTPSPVAQPEPTTATTLFRVQVGAFQTEENAKQLGAKLEREESLPIYITPGPPFRVQVGAFSQRDNAQQLQENLSDKGYETFLVQ